VYTNYQTTQVLFKLIDARLQEEKIACGFRSDFKCESSHNTTKRKKMANTCTTTTNVGTITIEQQQTNENENSIIRAVCLRLNVQNKLKS